MPSNKRLKFESNLRKKIWCLDLIVKNNNNELMSFCSIKFSRLDFFLEVPS